MVKAIFLDSGNVLIQDGFTPAIAEYERKHGIPKGELYASCHDRLYWKKFTLGNISEEVYFFDVAKDFPGPLNISELKGLMYQKFIPNNELLDYLATLKSKYILGIISNNPKEWFDYFWERLGWKDIFSITAVSGYLHIRKPDIKIFQIALDQAKVSGKEAMYVDDRADRVSGAQEVGMKILIYQNFDQFKEDINKGIN